jgi:hypothetical protein
MWLSVVALLMNIDSRGLLSWKAARVSCHGAIGLSWAICQQFIDVPCLFLPIHDDEFGTSSASSGDASNSCCVKARKKALYVQLLVRIGDGC